MIDTLCERIGALPAGSSMPPDCLASLFRLYPRAACCWLLVLLLQVQVDVQCKAFPASLGEEVKQVARDMQGGTSPYFRLGMLMEPGEGDRLMHLLRAQVCDDVCCVRLQRLAWWRALDPQNVCKLSNSSGLGLCSVCM